MDRENGIQHELDILVRAVQHFGDGKTCNGENIKYSNIYHANNYGGLCQEDQQAQQEQQAQEACSPKSLLNFTKLDGHIISWSNFPC